MLAAGAASLQIISTTIESWQHIIQYSLLDVNQKIFRSEINKNGKVQWSTVSLYEYQVAPCFCINGTRYHQNCKCMT